MSMGSRAMVACSSGTTRDGLDVSPLDGLFELVALVVDRDARSARESCPVEGRTMRNRRSARLQRRCPTWRSTVFCGWDWGSTHHGVCVIDDHGTIIKQWLVQHTHDDLGQLFGELAALADPLDLP